MYQQLSCQIAGHKALRKTVERLDAELAEKQAEIQAGLKRARNEVTRREAKVEEVFAALTALEDRANTPKAKKTAEQQTELRQAPSLEQNSNTSHSPGTLTADQTLQKFGSALPSSSAQQELLKRAKQRFARQAMPHPRWLLALEEMQSASRLLAAQAQADDSHFELSEAIANARSVL